MTGSGDFRVPSIWIERHAHRAHKRTTAENSAEIIVHRLHDRRRLLVLRMTMMKQKFRESRHQRGGSAVTGCIRDPKQPAIIFDWQPPVNVAADFDDRTITGGDRPT